MLIATIWTRGLTCGHSKTARHGRNRSGAALAGCLQRHSPQHVRTFRDEERELPAENRRYQAAKRRLETLISSGTATPRSRTPSATRRSCSRRLLRRSPSQVDLRQEKSRYVRCRPHPLAPTMFASDSAVVRTSCATWPQAGLRATHARPRTKRPLQLTRGPPPASVGAPHACPEHRPSERGVPAPRNSAEHVTPVAKIPEPRSAPQITDAADPSPQP